ncbi:MAG: tetratricopeptide repeat protein [bacterium]
MEDAARLIRRWCATATFALLAIGAGGGRTAARADDAALARDVAAEARDFAGRDDHGRAVACALAAIRLDPSLEDELSLLIAHQLTWQERAAEAVPWYRRRLEAEPDDREAKLGLARALSWSGDLDGAAAVYRELLADDANDAEARLGLARMEAWRDRPGAAARAYREALDRGVPDAREGLAAVENARGKHRAAEALYDAILADDPDDVSARVGRARARYWLGEEGAAERDLADIDTAEAADLRDAIRRDRGLRAMLFADRWNDRDDQENRTLGVRVEGSAGPGWRWFGLAAGERSEDPATGRVEFLTFGGGGSWRPSRDVAVHAEITAHDLGRNLEDGDVLDVGAGETRTGADIRETVALFDSWLTWTPIDWTRFDVGYGRVPVTTARALARGLRVNVASLAAERRLTERVSARIRAAHGDYDDGNTRRSLEADVRFGDWSLGPVHWNVGPGAAWIDFRDESPDHGYYSPDRYDTFHGTLNAWTSAERPFRVEGDVRLASERENDGDRFGVLSGGVELRWQATRHVGFGAFGRASTSRFDSSAGYERDGVGLRVFLAP